MKTETATTSEAMEIIDGIDFKTAESEIDEKTIVIEQRNERTNKEVKITFKRIEDGKSLVVLDNSAFMTVVEWTIYEGKTRYEVELDQPFNLILPADPFNQDTENR